MVKSVCLLIIIILILFRTENKALFCLLLKMFLLKACFHFFFVVFILCQRKALNVFRTSFQDYGRYVVTDASRIQDFCKHEDGKLRKVVNHFCKTPHLRCLWESKICFRYTYSYLNKYGDWHVYLHVQTIANPLSDY